MRNSFRGVLLVLSLFAIALGGCGGKASGPVIDTAKQPPTMPSSELTPESAAATATSNAATVPPGTPAPATAPPATKK